MTALVANQRFAATDQFEAGYSGDVRGLEVVTLASGGFLAAWSYYNGVFARLFDRHGSPIGAVFQLTSSSASSHIQIALAPLADGGFVATWTNFPFPDPYVEYRVFDAAGRPLGPEQPVTTAYSQQPSVATLAGGGFAVAYVVRDSQGNTEIKAQLFDSQFARQGGEIAVNTTTFADQTYPLAAPLPNGGFIVTWLDFMVMRGQTYDSAGQRIGGEFDVASSGTWAPSLTALPSGNLLVVYPAGELMAKILSPTGAVVVPGFQVNTSTSGTQYMPSAAVLPTGEFLITWRDATEQTNYYQDGDVRGQLFAADGSKIGSEYVVNMVTTGGQTEPATTAFGSGDVATLWLDHSSGSFYPVVEARLFFSTSFGTEGADALAMTSDRDFVFALGGNDSVNGAAAADELSGGGGNDQLTGGAGADVLIGGDGVDQLFSHSGEARDASGYNGFFSLFYTGTASEDRYAEKDSLSGGAGDDFLFAGYGDDVDGGAGTDRLYVSFQGAGAGVTADYRALATQASVIAGGATVSGIEHVDYLEGSEFDDLLAPIASIYAATGFVYGRGGNDHIIADYHSGWNDGAIYGGEGNDLIDVRAANYGPEVYGEGGDDHILVGGGFGTYYGGDGADRIDGNYESNVAYGGGGDDVLDGATLPDSLYGDAGNDTLYGGGDYDLIEGGDGEDLIYGDSSALGSGNGLSSQNDGDILRGGAGNDRIYGERGADVAEGGAGNDLIDGGAGDDDLDGGAGADRLIAGAGTDSLVGGEDNDVLYFGAALSSGDVADGAAGRDAIVLQGNVTAVLTDTNLVGIESISIQSGANATFGDTANAFYDYDVTTADGNVLPGQQLIVNAQSLRAGEDFTFDGSAETDGRFLIYGGHGVDDLTGGDGADVFFFEGSRWGAGDRVDGGAGRDALTISGGSGLTRIEFGADSFANIESISLNNHFATDPSQKPSYELVLHDGNVAPGGTLIVNGSSIPLGQVVNIDGRGVHDGNLILFGGGGHDVLTGGDGADLIIGGGGADSLTGGAGADTFRYDSASDSARDLEDLIGDFQSGSDRIDLSRIDADSTAAGNQAFTWIGAEGFSGSAGELRVRDSGVYRWIEGDTDGDGAADFSIAFHGSSAPQLQGDFIL
jgi:Ca2+-binding RTX toxin-like protein